MKTEQYWLFCFETSDLIMNVKTVVCTAVLMVRLLCPVPGLWHRVIAPCLVTLTSLCFRWCHSLWVKGAHSNHEHRERRDQTAEVVIFGRFESMFPRWFRTYCIDYWLLIIDWTILTAHFWTLALNSFRTGYCGGHWVGISSTDILTRFVHIQRDRSWRQQHVVMGGWRVSGEKWWVGVNQWLDGLCGGEVSNSDKCQAMSCRSVLMRFDTIFSFPVPIQKPKPVDQPIPSTDPIPVHKKQFLTHLLWLSSVKYCRTQKFCLLCRLSPVRSSLSFSKTVVARGNTAQLPECCFRAAKKNWFQVYNVSQS